MARPRVYDQDQILDAVEQLAVQSGPAAVTIRAISAAIGVSNGAVYHTFGSRAGLVGRAWLRADHRFLSMQSELIHAAPHGGIQAVVAAADAPAAFAEQYPHSSKLILTVRRAELLGPETPTEIAEQLHDLDAHLVESMVGLASALWDRKDAAAVDVITTCIVDLPAAILLQRNRLHDHEARQRLRAAVRAVLALGPPPPRHRRKEGNDA
ncbi:MAG TPA: TetR/AcrR family transcriptional regulator [Mycobacterium sp.]|nr:TetR/AcrR family transcriptional regulator [Mycobacterium sp.]HTX97617.1 TetR/AcrR family transcriptional regulator [Mycobacterium sp.]